MNIKQLIKTIFIGICLFNNTESIGQNKPNILWIVCEDIGPDLSFYGDDLAKTPTLAQLAKESMVYEKAFATTGVCAPSRSSIITGMYPTSIGTMHMRTGQDVASHGSRKYENSINRFDLEGKPIEQYSTVTPPHVKCFTEYLRQEGYYCTNNSKCDYQFAAPLTAWDENGNNASYINRAKDQPFFSVFNINITHESNLFTTIKRPLTIDPKKVIVPPYLPDTDSVRFMIARHYSNLELLDKEVSELLATLKKNNLYDNTIVFFYSDHGGPLPREKREVYDSGTRVPLMIKYLNKKAGRNSNLVSLVDLAPTVLELVGIKPPKHLEGQSLLTNKPRKFIYAHGDRFDEYTDRVRAIRDHQYLYIENQIPNKTGYKDLTYRKSIYSMNEIIALAKAKKLTPAQQKWFDVKGPEELYDVIKDPYQVNNLANDKAYEKVKGGMRKLLNKTLAKQGDKGAIAESKHIAQMWPNGVQPKTSSPIVKLNSNKELVASCVTEGASIAYLISDEKVTTLDRNQAWQIYLKPIKSEANKYYTFVAERIGYETSEMVSAK
jgi:N-sulfoglucosamine sulfohydrolase